MSSVIIVITASLGVLLTVSGVVGVWLALRTGQHTQTVRNFREAAASWREKAEALDADVAALHNELDTLSGNYDQLKSRYEVLESVVTGEAAIERLGVKVDGMQSAVILEIRLNRDVLRQIAQRQEGLS